MHESLTFSGLICYNSLYNLNQDNLSSRGPGLNNHFQVWRILYVLSLWTWLNLHPKGAPIQSLTATIELTKSNRSVKQGWQCSQPHRNVGRMKWDAIWNELKAFNNSSINFSTLSWSEDFWVLMPPRQKAFLDCLLAMTSCLPNPFPFLVTEKKAPFPSHLCTWIWPKAHDLASGTCQKLYKCLIKIS